MVTVIYLVQIEPKNGFETGKVKDGYQQCGYLPQPPTSWSHSGCICSAFKVNVGWILCRFALIFEFEALNFNLFWRWSHSGCTCSAFKVNSGSILCHYALIFEFGALNVWICGNSKSNLILWWTFEKNEGFVLLCDIRVFFPSDAISTQVHKHI